MAKEYYDLPITDSQDWGGDSSTGNKQVKGSRVQEWIKGKVRNLEGANIASEILNPSKFDGFVDNVSLTNQNIGSNYDWIKFDKTRKMFFAVVAGFDGAPDKYYRQYDKFMIYNMGEWPNAFPYDRKIYVYGSSVYLWDGEQLECDLISQEDFEAIFPVVGHESEGGV